MSQVCDICGGKDGEHFLNNGNLTSGKGHIHYQNIDRQSIELPCNECGGIGIYHFPGCSRLDGDGSDDPNVCDECFARDGKHLGECSHFSGKSEDLVPGCNHCNRDDVIACSSCIDWKFRMYKEDDPVNHPSHYTAYSGLEVIDLTEQMNFCRGNAVKYICRAGKKSKETEVQDLEKAIWYLNREIERIKKDI